MKKLRKWIGRALCGTLQERRVLYNILLHDETQEPHRVARNYSGNDPGLGQDEFSGLTDDQTIT